jgi:RHS repeat-associated protein
MEYGESAGTQTELTYQDYLYGGKEFDREYEINAYDFKARFYDITDDRFWSMDPMAEKYYSISPYAYCANNPVKYLDPDGKQFFVPLTPLLGLSDPILMSNKPIVTETMSKVGRVTNETTSKIEDYHIIPRTLRDNSVVKEARNEGFKFEGKENKISIDKFSKLTSEGQHGNHPSYTKETLNKLSDFQKENPGFTGKDALNAVRNIVKDVKETIKNNPNTKINDLYKTSIENIKTYNPAIIKSY